MATSVAVTMVSAVAVAVETVAVATPGSPGLPNQRNRMVLGVSVLLLCGA